MKRVLLLVSLCCAVLIPAGVVVAGGLGGGGGDDDVATFLLAGTAQPAQDPENSNNDVIRIDTLTAPFYGAVSRVLDAKITQLDNMLEFKSYFQNRSCGGGSPRITLSIDLNGDRTPDGNAWGYTSPPFAGCPPNRWQYDDVTDELPRWDLSQLAGFPAASALCTGTVPNFPGITCPVSAHSGYIPWTVFESLLTTLFPLHTVCDGALVDDSGWMPAAAGVAYYDVISLGRATWNNHGDTAGRGFAQGCTRPSHGDDKPHGDEDYDWDVDGDDSKFHDERRNRWKD
jgi:hypothetical protein